MPSVKLDFFQRGILQKAAIVFACLGSLALGAFILNWVDKRLFIGTIRNAEHQGVISPDVFTRLQIFIAQSDNTTILTIIYIGLLCAGGGWLFMRWAAKRNWSWPVTLSQAVEFKSAMRRLGLVDPLEQIEFVRKHKISVFIALSPLLQEEHPDVRVKLYAFAHNSAFSDKDVFAFHAGRQTLCLDMADCERLVQERKQSLSLGESVVLAEKERELQSIKETVSSLIGDKHNLEVELAASQKKNARLEAQTKILPAQAGSRIDRLRIEGLQWAALIPTMARLMKEASAGKKYTMLELESAFAEEWERRTDLQARMLALTGSEATKPSESMMGAVKAEFKDAGLFSTGGRPRKNP